MIRLEMTMIKLNPTTPTPLFFPPIQLCTGKPTLPLVPRLILTGIDNAAMIAWTALLRIQAKPGLLRGDGEGYDLPLRPKWSLEALYDDLNQVD
jgi:tRNA A37 threonylcarbamoyltransferase TsaD